MAYQSLYRRYRPQKFAEIKGQDHVVSALRSAVRDDKVGHAYLFHGPRGTGKTSTARVLAKALNCENLGEDGEPCGTCESCVSIEQGRSFDLHELDAASNNKVDDMRSLLERVNLGTPGRAKVYLLDEVHMLTPGAENALLKTLEEPPDHVTWILATTEPHKVVETVRSRCQVFELGLLGAEGMAEHVRYVIGDAELDVDDDALDYVVAVGGGSARDTLSALDRVVAAGGAVEIDATTDSLLSALATRDSAAALAAVGEAIGRGRDPRAIGEQVLAGLRDAFLTTMGAPPPRLAEHERARAADLASQLSPAFLTRALEGLGAALIDMRQAPDPRVDIEVAMVRLCRPDADRSLDALRERVAQLEAQCGATPPAAADQAEVQGEARPEQAEAPPEQPQLSTDGSESSPASPGLGADSSPEPPTSAEPASSRPPGGDPAAAARQALAEVKAAAAAAPAPVASAAAKSAAVSAPPPAVPTVDPSTLRPGSPREVVELAGRHLGLGEDVVVARAREMLPPADGPRDPDELQPLWNALIAEAESAGAVSAPPVAEVPVEPETPVAEVPVEPETRFAEVPADPEPESADDTVDLTELVDAPSHAEEMIDRLSEAFPGAELVSTDEEES